MSLLFEPCLTHLTRYTCHQLAVYFSVLGVAVVMFTKFAFTSCIIVYDVFQLTTTYTINVQCGSPKGLIFTSINNIVPLVQKVFASISNIVHQSYCTGISCYTVKLFSLSTTLQLSYAKDCLTVHNISHTATALFQQCSISYDSGIANLESLYRGAGLLLSTQLWCIIYFLQNNYF